MGGRGQFPLVCDWLKANEKPLVRSSLLLRSSAAILRATCLPKLTLLACSARAFDPRYAAIPGAAASSSHCCPGQCSDVERRARSRQGRRGPAGEFIVWPAWSRRASLFIERVVGEAMEMTWPAKRMTASRPTARRLPPELCGLYLSIAARRAAAAGHDGNACEHGAERYMGLDSAMLDVCSRKESPEAMARRQTLNAPALSQELQAGLGRRAASAVNAWYDRSVAAMRADRRKRAPGSQRGARSRVQASRHSGWSTRRGDRPGAAGDRGSIRGAPTRLYAIRRAETVRSKMLAVLGPRFGRAR